MPCVLGDIQVIIHAPANPKHKGFEHALIASTTITMFKFSIWPPWDFITIGSRMNNLADEVKLYFQENHPQKGQVNFE